MARRRKKKRKKERAQAETAMRGHGFELGDQQRAMLWLDADFNQNLHDANIVACAYGEDRVDGYPGALPVISLVGGHREPLQLAFAHFERWGCEDDGDVVDVQLMLKTDGSYLFAVGPDVERAMYRLQPHRQLVQPLTVGIHWIKRLDTTNPMLHRIAEYCRSPLAPVLISAGTADLTRQPPDIRSLKVIPNLPRLVKFGLKIYSEKDHPDHWLLSMREGGGFRRRPPPGPIFDPEECIRLRRKTIDVAFPVSRERIRRAGLVEAVRSLKGFENVGADQIEQAAVNLMLSAELADGRPHFAGLGPNYRDVIWEHIFKRVETAYGENPITSLDPTTVATQIELDVAAVLACRGIPTRGVPFRILQTLFRRQGYAGR